MAFSAKDYKCGLSRLDTTIIYRLLIVFYFGWFKRKRPLSSDTIIVHDKREVLRK